MSEKGTKILIAERQSEALFELRELVASAGYRPIAAMGCEEALALLRSLSPDALLIGQLEPGDEAALRAASEMSGVRVLAVPPNKADLIARLKALFSPSPASDAGDGQGGGMVTKLLDELAVALADEISDQDDLLAFRLPPPAQSQESEEPRQEGSRASNNVTAPGGRRLTLVSSGEDNLADLHISDEFKSPLGSDGVTQILGALAQSLEEEPETQGGRFSAGPPGPTSPGRLHRTFGDIRSRTEPSAPDLSTSLFDLAVGDAVKRDAAPVVTRVARPTGGNTPPPLALSEEEESSLKSAIFTPISELQSTPTPPPRLQAGSGASGKREEGSSPRIASLPRPQSSSAPPAPRDLSPPASEAPEFLVPLRPERPAQNAPGDRVGAARLLLKNAKMLHSLFVEQKTGILTSRALGRERSLEISRGALVEARSNVPEDHIATLLYREGKLTRTQWEEALSWGERSAEEIAHEIFRRGFARRGELEAVLERQREEILAGLLEGECVFRPAPEGKRPLPTAPPLSRLLVDGVRRRLGAAEARALLSRATVARTSCPACSLEALSLAQDEMAFLSQLDGSRPVEEILPKDLPAELILPLLLALEVLGLLRVVSREAPEVEVEDERRIDRARIESKFEEVLLCDYFELLGVSRRATLYEIRKAYQALSEAFDPERYRDPYFADLLPRLEEIQEILEDALAVLSDDATRQAYQANLTAE